MAVVEEVDRREVVALDDRGLHLAHEARRRHREIVPHHDNGLQLPAVALAQGFDQLGLLLGPPRVQPLLELVHRARLHHLVTAGRTTTPPQVGEGLDQSQISRQLRQPLAKSTQDPGFGFLRRCFDIGRDDDFDS